MPNNLLATALQIGSDAFDVDDRPLCVTRQACDSSDCKPITWPVHHIALSLKRDTLRKDLRRHLGEATLLARLAPEGARQIHPRPGMQSLAVPARTQGLPPALVVEPTTEFVCDAWVVICGPSRHGHYTNKSMRDQV